MGCPNVTSTFAIGSPSFDMYVEGSLSLESSIAAIARFFCPGKLGGGPLEPNQSVMGGTCGDKAVLNMVTRGNPS